MEYKKDEITQEQWDEMRWIARNFLCAECEADLEVHTVPERGTIRVGCLNQEHHGWIEKETYTQAYRRGKEVHPMIRANIERRALLPGGYDMGTALTLVKVRFPRAELDDPSAALFITDCVRLDLDPFLGEIVPATFYDSKSKRRVVQPIITEDGYLSMGARGCPEEWNGPPKTMRLEDFLMTLEEHKGKPYDDIKVIAKDIKRSLVKDENAELYYAIGRRKGQSEDVFAPGWFKTSEETKETREGKEYETIGGKAPGNQARVRAIKRFIREVYPESKAKMRQMTQEWLERAAGFDEVKNIIEAEYHIVTEESPTKPEGGEKIGEAAGKEESGVENPGTTILSPPQGKEKEKIAREPSAEPAGRRDPNTVTEAEVKTATDLAKVANQCWGWQPDKLWKELGYFNQRNYEEAGLEKPWDSFLKLKAEYVRQ